MEQKALAGLKAGSDVARGSCVDIGRVLASTKYLVECFDRCGNLKWTEEFHNRVVNTGLDDLLDKYFKGSSYTAAHFVGLIGAGTGTVSVNSSSDDVTGSGTSFVTGDNGSDIIIVGAGAAGVDLATTIDGFTNGTTIDIATNASTTVSGAAYAVEPRAADTMASHAGFSEDTNYSNANRPTLTLGAVSGQSVDNSASKAAFTINADTRVFGAFVSTNNTKGGSTGTLYGGGLFSRSRAVENGDTLNVTVTATMASA